MMFFHLPAWPQWPIHIFIYNRENNMSLSVSKIFVSYKTKYHSYMKMVIMYEQWWYLFHYLSIIFWTTFMPSRYRAVNLIIAILPINFLWSHCVVKYQSTWCWMATTLVIYFAYFSLFLLQCCHRYFNINGTIVWLYGNNQLWQ